VEKIAQWQKLKMPRNGFRVARNVFSAAPRRWTS